MCGFFICIQTKLVLVQYRNVMYILAGRVYEIMGNYCVGAYSESSPALLNTVRYEYEIGEIRVSAASNGYCE